MVGNTEVADPREGTRKQHVLSPRQEAMGQWLCVCAKSLQLCPTLCNSNMDYVVHGILQARILEWVAFSFSRGSSQPRDQTCTKMSVYMYASHEDL